VVGPPFNVEISTPGVEIAGQSDLNQSGTRRCSNVDAGRNIFSKYNCDRSVIALYTMARACSYRMVASLASTDAESKVSVVLLHRLLVGSSAHSGRIEETAEPDPVILQERQLFLRQLSH
jgi:hypothetical protein